MDINVRNKIPQCDIDGLARMFLPEIIKYYENADKAYAEQCESQQTEENDEKA